MEPAIRIGEPFVLGYDVSLPADLLLILSLFGLEMRALALGGLLE
jgi:hypothetical protein